MWRTLTRKMKDSGVEWIGEIPEDWEVKKVKYMFRIVNGNGFPENLQGEKEGDYPFYKNSDINKLGIYINKSNNYISKNTATINKFTVIPSKSILIGKIGEALKRNHRKINLSECMIDNNMMALVPKENELFSYYLLTTIDMFWFDNNGTIPSVNSNKLRNFKIPYVNKTLQKNIVEILNNKNRKIDKLISSTQQSITELKKYKQSLITEAVTKGLDPNVEMKDSGIEWIGEIPEDWKLTKLKFLLKSNLLYGANESGIPYSPSLPRYIRITDIIENNKLTSDNKLSLSKEKAENYLLKEGDLLFARSGASVGKTFLVESQNTNNAFAGYLIKASFKNNNISKFVYYYTLSSAFEAWKDSITIQSTIQNIGADKYNNLPLPIPSKYLQQEIVSYLDEQTARIDKLIEDKTKVIEELEDYKKSLIYEYVTGKKEV